MDFILSEGGNINIVLLMHSSRWRESSCVFTFSMCGEVSKTWMAKLSLICQAVHQSFLVSHEA